MKKAVVLLSGGPDSATSLAVAKSQGFECYVLSFNYGQKDRAELNAAKKIVAHFNVRQHEVIRLPIEQLLGGCALTNKDVAIPVETQYDKIPVTYVPARNTIFLSIALGWAEVLGAQDIFIGVNAVDYSNYPDCRSEYIEAFEKMASLATKAGVENTAIKINTPLIHLSKAETMKLGASLGVDFSMTVSCYQATAEGYACGTCESCYYRKKGFAEAGMADPTLYI